LDKEIELQKIQALQNDFQAWFSAGASLWVGGLIGLLILILTVYYNKQFSPDAMVNWALTIITAGIVYAMFGIYGSWFMNKRSNEFLTFVDKLLAKVEKGEALGSIMELKKQSRKKSL
jgi:hypothetical protein